MSTDRIRILRPSQPGGHQFVIYADSCSGVPNTQNAHNLATINQVIQRLETAPEFICFPGDEIIGLTNNESNLRHQWDYWLNHEMAWLKRDHIPLYHTTGNHTAYNAMSNRVFADVLSYLPRNGPQDQLGLSYFVRRGNLLMIFVNTLFQGEGLVETQWLEQSLQQHSDATMKLIFGHHPVFSVNGFSGPYQRDIDPVAGRKFWDILVQHGVMAYVCSHILAFDVQVHQGVLQILTAGAGTHHRMPEDVEYLHCVQAAIAEDSLRYQVLDTSGQVREWLQWPPNLPPSDTWETFTDASLVKPDQPVDSLYIWQISGELPASSDGDPQTLVSGWHDESDLSTLWIGFIGPQPRLTIILHPTPGRSPHQWYGPSFASGQPFSFQIGLHTGMGPGGLLWRENDQAAWSSLLGASAWGIERLPWPEKWSIGRDQGKNNSLPFKGRDLKIKYYLETNRLFEG